MLLAREAIGTAAPTRNRFGTMRQHPCHDLGGDRARQARTFALPNMRELAGQTRTACPTGHPDEETTKSEAFE